MTYEETTPQSTIETMERHMEEADIAFNGWVQFTADEYYLVKQALEKQVPKKPIEKHYEQPGEKPYIKYTCPNGCCISFTKPHGKVCDNYYCNLCGQKLDWSEYK